MVRYKESVILNAVQNRLGGYRAVRWHYKVG